MVKVKCPPELSKVRHPSGMETASCEMSADCTSFVLCGVVREVNRSKLTACVSHHFADSYNMCIEYG